MSATRLKAIRAGERPVSDLKRRLIATALTPREVRLWAGWLAPKLTPMPLALPADCPAHFEAHQLQFERPRPPQVPPGTEMPLENKVVLQCHVGRRGKLYQCAVESEKPSGWGLAEWATRYAESWRVTNRSVARCPVIGTVVEIPFKINVH